MLVRSGTGGEKLKLVVPTSFSQKSEMALDFALVYSQTFNADIYLFHAFEDKSSNFRHVDRVNEEYMERMRTTVIQAIERVTAQGVTHTVEDVHRRLSHGHAWKEILKITAGITADMIIMGAPSTNRFRKLIDKAPCSLVLVKEKDPEFVA